MSLLPEAEVMWLLTRIEMRDVFLEPHTPVPYNGVIQYDASNGWRLAVRMRNGRWDGLDFVESKDGKMLNAANMSELLRGLKVTDETLRVQFGIR